MSVRDEYEWLEKMLNDEFGKENVEPRISDMGNSLTYYINWSEDRDRTCEVLARKHGTNIMERGDYMIEEVPNPFAGPRPTFEAEYDLNQQSDPVKEIRDMIIDVRNRWTKKGGE